ncbi:unnamed protein product [Clavelina lepadiformis]|uniref:Uncharacterized protein n=1 Tax=Clavelina lepadiformis TaxID=159417 RepID=A0ABP0G6V6_CLALP
MPRHHIRSVIDSGGAVSIVKKIPDDVTHCTVHRIMYSGELFTCNLKSISPERRKLIDQEVKKLLDDDTAGHDIKIDVPNYFEFLSLFYLQAQLEKYLEVSNAVFLNLIRTGVGRFGECMHRWGLKISPSCNFGAESQTAEHIFDCRVLHPPISQEDLKTPDEEGKKWLQLVAEYP